VLARETRIKRWRPGDRVRTAALVSLSRASGTLLRAGRLVSVGRVRTERARLTTDIGEHRHIRAGLQRLAGRAGGLALHCAGAGELYEQENARWGRAREAESSVFQTRYAPRIRALADWGRRASELRDRLLSLERAHRFLVEAGPVRTPLSRTPIFASRRGYQEAYRLLRALQRMAGMLVEGDELRLRFRRLSTLYEYWCFIRVVGLVRDMPGMGRPEPDPRFHVIDDVYRPDLAPGQTFEFPWRHGRTVHVTYEPDFPPLGRTSAHAGPFRAALSRGTLRPDITIEIRSGQSPQLHAPHAPLAEQD
jgi:hypothetical protein